ncbi:Sir2 family NAD-dependent protein deacetylase [Dehalococcoidia bacterium]|nr:Sir2 family NAD-dependent protein deacetylase [Dehalococcoidia bacterium]
MTSNEQFLIQKVADLIVTSSKVVVFTGAGISTESGIPDFRGPGGLWTKYDPEIFTVQRFLHDPEARKTYWKLRGSGEFMHSDVQPNPAHYAVAELEKIGKLDCVITQNVDGLHEKAGNSPDKVIHLHGTMEKVKCLQCGRQYSMDEVYRWIAGGIEVPDCPECSGLLKPQVVFFGEAMPAWETAEAQRRSENCDLCIVIGSSLVVYPAALMPQYALQGGARLAIINREPTDLDPSADVCIHEGAGKTMSAIMAIVREKIC